MNDKEISKMMLQNKERLGIYEPNYKENERPFFITLENQFELVDSDYSNLYLHYSDDEGEFVWRNTLNKNWPTDITTFTDSIIKDFNLSNEEKLLFSNFRVDAWKHLNSLQEYWSQILREEEDIFEDKEELESSEEYQALIDIRNIKTDLRKAYFGDK
ncbi:hypothetical protein [Companilactobacillus pabuli]|jgi:hypothetical protein|uniref:hypothetical protein n=1 Tax=Companilactobacillus pabuli TaxID=2714036 RepID=UPI00065B1D72|nr:hypothetical protein [Companilactobacillus pabuli]AKP03066.1 hypothetical protein ABB45_05170 [Companilactobacillus farciminis]AKS51366.1 hypothetical protein ABB44_05180 [Companilactobacillus farciminis]MDG5112153.1 hypothetical protein [Companilactobacillus pabuli]GAQ02267.1 hypothetical protein NBRC111452_2110 [Companilactobacillus farciminis]